MSLKLTANPAKPGRVKVFGFSLTGTVRHGLNLFFTSSHFSDGNQL
jgi:hypothetical protein